MTERTSSARSSRKLQKTRPKQGKPVEIPVPKRRDFEKALKRATKSSGRSSD